MQYMYSSVFVMVLLSGTCPARDVSGEAVDLKNRKDRISYSLGYQIGGDFKKEKTDIDPVAFLKGVKDALARSGPALSAEEMKPLLVDMKKRIVERQRAEKLEMVEQRLGAGTKFLEDNAKKEGVTTLPSGLQYKVIREGDGRQPKPSDRVKVHYSGRRIDGTEFSSSYRKGEAEIFHVNGVLPGITEALQLMKEGAKWKIFMPSNLAFGKRGVLAYRTVIYDLELISIEPSEHD